MHNVVLYVRRVKLCENDEGKTFAPRTRNANVLREAVTAFARSGLKSNAQMRKRPNKSRSGG